MFGFEIMDIETKQITNAEVDYRFGIYHVTFRLLRASQYSSIITLTQKGGLRATYYETTNFQAPFNDR